MDYRVEIHKSRGWNAFSCADIGISLFNPDPNAEAKTRALLCWASKRFDSVRIILGDSLHRHNIMNEQGASEPVARAQANLMGNAWIDRYDDALWDNGITVVRWDMAIGHTDFEATKTQYEALSRTNETFSKSIESDIDGFVQRKVASGLPINAERTRLFSRAYLIEELAADTLLARETPAAYIYAGSELASYAVIRSGRVQNAPEGLVSQPHVTAGFKRAKSRTPALIAKMPCCATFSNSRRLECKLG